MKEISLDLDNKKTTERICDFLKREFKKRKKSCAVLGISGGVDSTTTAFLCKRAGLELYAVFMPYGELSKKEKVKSLIRTLDLSPRHFIEIDITGAADKQVKIIQGVVVLDSVDKGNVVTRTRMAVLYALARKLNGLVLGTENLSEYWLGYFTLHGDQASDINPLGGLWKTQVEKLAKYLSVPQEILNQKPSAELWEGQTDEKELGFSYQEADPILELFCVKKYSKRKLIDNCGFRPDLVERVLKRVTETGYKRQPPPKILDF